MKYDHTHYMSASYSDDPAQPLLPTTRFHPLPPSLSSRPPETVRETTSCEAEYHRTATPKSASGTYIGLLCIFIVWLLPIGIIVSGGTTAEVATKVSSFLGQREQILSRDPNSSESFTLDDLRRGGHCLRYRTREYTAKSLVPSRGQAALKECRRSYAKIHDVELKPTYCENLVRLTVGIGRFLIDDVDFPRVLGVAFGRTGSWISMSQIAKRYGYSSKMKFVCYLMFNEESTSHHFSSTIQGCQATSGRHVCSISVRTYLNSYLNLKIASHC